MHAVAKCSFIEEAIKAKGSLERSATKLIERLFKVDSISEEELEDTGVQQEREEQSHSSMAAELEKSIQKATSVCSSWRGPPRLQNTLKKEMGLYEATQELPKNLKLLSDALL